MALHICPFRYKRYNPETGKLHTAADNPYPDDHETKRYCNFGKGPWCAQCMHYRQWKMSNAKWIRMVNRIKKENKAPWLWRKIRPERVVNPVIKF